MLNSSPPFRSGGKGSKQVSAVLNQSILSPQNNLQCSPVPKLNFNSPEPAERRYVFVRTEGMKVLLDYFGIVLGNNGNEGVLIQPLRLNPLDSRYLVKWEGHIWLAKESNVMLIKAVESENGVQIIADESITKNLPLLTYLQEKFPRALITEESPEKCNGKCDPINHNEKEDEEGDEMISLESENTLDDPLFSGFGSLVTPQVVQNTSSEEFIIPVNLFSETVPAQDPYHLNMDNPHIAEMSFISPIPLAKEEGEGFELNLPDSELQFHSSFGIDSAELSAVEQVTGPDDWYWHEGEEVEQSNADQPMQSKKRGRKRKMQRLLEEFIRSCSNPSPPLYRIKTRSKSADTHVSLT